MTTWCKSLPPQVEAAVNAALRFYEGNPKLMNYADKPKFGVTQSRGPIFHAFGAGPEDIIGTFDTYGEALMFRLAWENSRGLV